MDTIQTPTNHLYMLQQLCSVLALSGNGLRRHGEVALVGSAELASKSRSFDLNTLKLQSLLRTQRLLELRTYAGWMMIFRATPLTLRTTHLLMDTRSGARQGDNQTYIDLLSSGQHELKAGLPSSLTHG
jgi:hypothetical protein